MCVCILYNPSIVSLLAYISIKNEIKVHKMISFQCQKKKKKSVDIYTNLFGMRCHVKTRPFHESPDHLSTTLSAHLVSNNSSTSSLDLNSPDSNFCFCLFSKTCFSKSR